jgi:hypothetical protein
MYAAEAAKIAGKWDLAQRYLKEFGQMVGRQEETARGLDEIEVLKKLRAKDYNGALDAALALRAKYGSISNELQVVIYELQRRLGRDMQVSMSLPQ